MARSNLIAVLIAGSAALALSTAADAATVNARQRHQQLRIAQGLATGSLTVREAVRLEARQVSIARQQARMRANDGVLGPGERAVLQQRLDRASAAIWRQKHDAHHRELRAPARLG